MDIVNEIEHVLAAYSGDTGHDRPRLLAEKGQGGPCGEDINGPTLP